LSSCSYGFYYDEVIDVEPTERLNSPPEQVQSVPNTTNAEPNQIIVIDGAMNQNEQSNSNNDNMIIDDENGFDHNGAQLDIQLNLDDYLLIDNNGDDKSVSE